MATYTRMAIPVNNAYFNTATQQGYISEATLAKLAAEREAQRVAIANANRLADEQRAASNAALQGSVMGAAAKPIASNLYNYYNATGTQGLTSTEAPVILDKPTTTSNAIEVTNQPLVIDKGGALTMAPSTTTAPAAITAQTGTALADTTASTATPTTSAIDTTSALAGGTEAATAATTGAEAATTGAGVAATGAETAATASNVANASTLGSTSASVMSSAAPWAAGAGLAIGAANLATSKAARKKPGNWMSTAGSGLMLAGLMTANPILMGVGLVGSVAGMASNMLGW